MGDTRTGPPANGFLSDVRSDVLRGACVLLLALAGVGLLAGPASAQYRGSMQDGEGYDWDISQGGQVGDGTSDAFDGGFHLLIEGQNFHGMARPAEDAENGVDCQAQQFGSLRVHRRIRILEEPALCRWVDVVENRGDDARSVVVSIQSNQGSDSGTQLVRTLNADGELGDSIGDETVALLTDDGNPNGRDPAVLHVFAVPGAGVVPRSVNLRGDNIRAELEVEIPAGQRRVFAFFGVQRNDRDELVTFLEELELDAALEDLDSDLLRDLVNVRRGGFGGVPRIEVAERSFGDQLFLESGDRLVGSIRTRTVPLEGDLGPLEIPIERIAGIRFATDDDLGVGVLLESGEILRGRVGVETVAFDLSGGQSLSVPVDEIREIACEVREDGGGEDRPETPDRRLAVLRSGDLLFVRLAPDEPVRLRTPYGAFDFAADDVAAIRFATEQGLQEVLLADGARFSGVLDADELVFERDPDSLVPGQGALSIPTFKITRYGRAEMPEPETSDEPLCTMRNEDVFRARPAGTLTVRTRFGDVDVEPRHLRSIAFELEPPGAVAVTLWDGATLSGVLESDRIRLLRGDRELRVGAAAFLRIDFPSPEVPPSIADRVMDLVEDLGVAEPEARRRAREEIAQMGSPILPLLEDLQDHPDIEVRAALEEIIRRIQEES